MSTCAASDNGRHYLCSRGWCMDCESFPADPGVDAATLNPGIDETARDNDADALADLGDVGDLDQYDRSAQ